MEGESGFQKLIDGATATIGVVNSAVGAVQSVFNLFGKKSSEELVNQFTDQGFSKFNQNTRISATTLPTAIFDSWAKSALKNLYNVPSKHRAGIDHMVKYAKYVDDDSWLSLQGTFDISSGGMSNQIQLFTSRDQACERMNVVFIYTSTEFKLKPDTFVISKSSSKLGGAFSKTKLQWKTENTALKTDDLKFVSEYFLTLGMGQIQQSRSIANYAATKNCGDFKAPPKQIDPFADEDEDDYQPVLMDEDEADDLGGQSFSVSGGVSGQSGGTNYNANFGYKNEWDEDDHLGAEEHPYQYRKQGGGYFDGDDDLGAEEHPYHRQRGPRPRPPRGGWPRRRSPLWRNEWDEDDHLGGVAGAMMSPAAFKIARWGQRVGPYLGPMKSAMGFDQDDDLGRVQRSGRPSAGDCHFTQQRLCGKCGSDKNCRRQCHKQNMGVLRRACGRI